MFFGYPNESTEVINLDFILRNIEEFRQKLTDVETRWTEEANKYTDQKFSEIIDDFNQLETDFNDFKYQVNQSNQQFRQEVNNQITSLEFSFAQFKEHVDDEVQAAYAYTNQAIAFNNDYLINEMSKELRKITVINYFTGLPTTIQDMFDYLCRFHLQEAITFTELATASKTFTELAAYNMSYTDLALNGKSIIV